MDSKRSLLDDPSFSKIGSKGGKKGGGGVSPGKLILLAVLLVGVAVVAAVNLGLFSKKPPSSATGPGATNTPEVTAELEKQKEHSRQLKEKGLITESGS